MTVTRDQMAEAELAYIGKPISVNNVQSLVIWMTSEDTQAEWNPHATTQPEAGATEFNSAGVKNYPTFQVGLQAFKDTIENGYYNSILQNLSVSAAPAFTCSAIENSPWGSKPSSALVAQVLSDWPIYADVVINGSEAVTPPPEPVPTPTPTSIPIPPAPKPKELTMDSVLLPNGDIVSHAIGTDNHYYEITRKAGTAGQSDPNGFSIVDVTDVFKGWPLVAS